MDNIEAERLYATLKSQLDSGQITKDQFISGVHSLRYQDYHGTWWAMNPVDGGWLRWTGSAWVPQQPLQSQVPGNQGDVGAHTVPGFPSIQSPPQPISAPDRSPPESSRKVYRTIFRTRAGLLALAGIFSGIGAWLWYPYLLGIASVGLGLVAIFVAENNRRTVVILAGAGMMAGCAAMLVNTYFFDLFPPDFYGLE